MKALGKMRSRKTMKPEKISVGKLLTCLLFLLGLPVASMLAVWVP